MNKRRIECLRAGSMANSNLLGDSRTSPAPQHRHPRTWWPHSVAVGFCTRVGLKFARACGWKQEVVCDKAPAATTTGLEACTICSRLWLLSRPSDFSLSLPNPRSSSERRWLSYDMSVRSSRGGLFLSRSDVVPVELVLWSVDPQRKIPSASRLHNRYDHGPCPFSSGFPGLFAVTWVSY